MHRRLIWLTLTAVSIAFAVGGLVYRIDPVAFYNPSESQRPGVYIFDKQSPTKIGDTIAIMPPEDVATFLADRGYLPHGLPLLKTVAADAGDTVCRHGPTVYRNGRPIAAAASVDHMGRQLPSWTGCRTIGDQDVFLIATRVSDSLDSRYFGPFPKKNILGKVRLLFPTSTKEESK